MMILANGQKSTAKVIIFEELSEERIKNTL